jgi:hypothetical protein
MNEWKLRQCRVEQKIYILSVGPPDSWSEAYQRLARPAAGDPDITSESEPQVYIHYMR